MGNFNSVRGGSFDRSTRKVVGGGEAPSAVGNDAHTHAYRFGIRSAAHFAILGTKCPAALSNDACVGVSCTAQRGDVQGPVGDVVHGGRIKSTTATGAADCADLMARRAPALARSLPPAIPSTILVVWWTRAHSPRRTSPL